MDPANGVCWLEAVSTLRQAVKATVRAVPTEWEEVWAAGVGGLVFGSFYKSQGVIGWAQDRDRSRLGTGVLGWYLQASGGNRVAVGTNRVPQVLYLANQVQHEVTASQILPGVPGMQ